MSTKTFKKLKNLTDAELRTRLREVEEELFKLKLQHVTGQLDKPSILWKTRKEIARVKMLISTKGGVSAPQAAPKVAKPAAKTKAAKSSARA